MNGLDLFTGSGIGSLTLRHTIPGYRTIGYVDSDEYCCKEIERRQRDGMLDAAPIWNLDIEEFNRRIATIYAGYVDIIFGGPPCQPFSIAGADSKGAGEFDERDCFPHFVDTIRTIRPRYVLCENVPNLLISHPKYFGRILTGFSSLGYSLEYDTVSASFVGAGHARPRVWIFADAQDIGWKYALNGEGAGHYCGSKRDKVSATGILAFNADEFREEVRATEFVRTANGIPDRMDRIRTIGNAWVPQVVRRILCVGDFNPEAN